MSNNRRVVSGKRDVLHQNLRHLDLISKRLLEDVRTKNEIIQRGLDSAQNNHVIVMKMKGGCGCNS